MSGFLFEKLVLEELKMICGSCGAEIRDGSTFCTSCGNTIQSAETSVKANQDTRAKQTPAQEGTKPMRVSHVEVDSSPKSTTKTATTEATEKQDPTSTGQSSSKTGTPSPKRKKSSSIVAGIVGAALVGVLVLVGCLVAFSGAPAQATTYPIRIMINAVGYTEADSMIPVIITGTTAEGETFDETFYVGGNGEGIELPEGSYEASFPASPLTTDGVVYRPPAGDYSFTVDENEEEDYEEPLIPAPFEEIDPADITDEDILAMRKYYERNPRKLMNVDELIDLIKKKRAEAIAARMPQEPVEPTPEPTPAPDRTPRRNTQPVVSAPEPEPEPEEEEEEEPPKKQPTYYDDYIPDMGTQDGYNPDPDEDTDPKDPAIGGGYYT